MKCWYEENPSRVDGKPLGPACHGLVSLLAHDKRGCVTVCDAHAKWRETTSCAMGHSRHCPDPVQPWLHFTAVKKNGAL